MTTLGPRDKWIALSNTTLLGPELAAAVAAEAGGLEPSELVRGEFDEG